VAGYNTQQMAYTRKPYELNYFSRNEWVDTPGRMLEPILVSALEASGRFQSVVPSYARIPADLRLDTEIILLVQDFSVQPSQSRFALHARLIELASGQEIASQTLEAQEPMSKENPYSGVIALNQALEHILRELVSFCVQGSAKAHSLNSSAID
jgi:cholesterol transport system auxiliary component